MLKRYLQRWLGIQELSDKLALMTRPKVYFKYDEGMDSLDNRTITTVSYVPIEKGYDKSR